MPFDPANPPRFYFIQVQAAGTDLDQETSYLDFLAGLSVTLDAANNAARIAPSFEDGIYRSKLSASANTTISAGHGAYVVDEFEIADTIAFEIAAGAALEIG